VCNKSFRKKGVLITHKCTHGGERSYVCDVCYKAFSDRSSLIKQTFIVVSAFILEKCVIRRSVNRAIGKDINACKVLSALMFVMCVIRHSVKRAV
jgi:predicted metal-binding protein